MAPAWSIAASLVQTTLLMLSSATKRDKLCSSIYQVAEDLRPSLRPIHIVALLSSRRHESSNIGDVHIEDG